MQTVSRSTGTPSVTLHMMQWCRLSQTTNSNVSSIRVIQLSTHDSETTHNTLGRRIQLMIGGTVIIGQKTLDISGWEKADITTSHLYQVRCRVWSHYLLVTGIRIVGSHMCLAMTGIMDTLTAPCRPSPATIQLRNVSKSEIGRHILHVQLLWTIITDRK